MSIQNDMSIDEAIEHLEGRYTTVSICGTYQKARAENDAIDMAIAALHEKKAADDNEPCDFCRVFDFSSARTQVDKYGARVSLALSTTRFDREEQFNYCPVCGRRRNE